jgi:general secretion pathway protein K
MLDPPYFRKNAPFDSLEEVHLVRGVSDDFWSTFIEPEPNDAKKRNITVWGSGKVNVNTANSHTLLAIICGGSTTAKVCMDPLELGKFLMVTDLIRTLGAGVPLFGSPRNFISTLAQQTPVGQILQMMGISPIQFNAPDVAMKEISTESKVFSLVATGYVKSGQRETRHRIHAVVDMRGAPTPENLMMKALSATTGGALGGAAGAGLNPLQMPTATPGGPVGASAIPGNLPAGATADSDAGFLIPSPAGRIIYFRMD